MDKTTQENYIVIDNVTDDIRNILSNIPNKNSLYRAIDLKTTYLNLKHFIAGKENLKERSENALINKLGYKKVTMYIKEDNLSVEEKTYINSLQVKFLEDLNDFIQQFLDERKRFTKSELENVNMDEINKQINGLKEYDLSELDNLLNDETDGLNISLED